MTTSLLLLCLTATPQQAPAVEYPYGCVSQPRYSLEEAHHGALELYEPQPGDLIFGSIDNLFWKTLYLLAGTGRPSHAALIVRSPGGELMVLESGYGRGTPWTRIISLVEWRRTYEGLAWLRKRKTPLTDEQNGRLWEFGRQVNDQPYSLPKLVAQLTPLRKRGPLRTYFVGKPIGPGHHYTCAEMVLEALVHADLLPAEATRPGATYPRDMFFDWSTNPQIHNNLAIKDGWEVPRWWTRCYVATPGS
jgi:hypothetical protein